MSALGRGNGTADEENKQAEESKYVHEEKAHDVRSGKKKQIKMLREKCAEMSLCRGCAVNKSENASRPTPRHGRLRLGSFVRFIGWLLFVSDFPEMHQATDTTALLFRFLGGIARGFLLLVEFAPLGMGANDQLRKAG
jgi:hypothetical protein